MNLRFLKRWVRRFVLLTSVGPVASLYRGIYRVGTAAVVSSLKKCPGVQAVYLQRGCARGEEDMIPGVSDVDLVAFVPEIDSNEAAVARAAYRRYARAIPFLESELDVFDEVTFYRGFETTRGRFRRAEGKRNWQRLYGSDVFERMPQLRLEDMYGSVYHEFRWWWRLFSGRMLHAPANQRDRILRNSFCYKIVCEFLKVDLALLRGVLTFGRRTALEAARSHLDDANGLFVEQIREVAARRFTRREPGILDDTKDFLVRQLDDFHRDFRDHEHTRAADVALQGVDCPAEECLPLMSRSGHLQALIDHVRNRWSDTYRSAHLVTSCYLDFDRWMLLLAVDPRRIPSFRAWADLCSLNVAGRGRRQGIGLGLLLSNCAVQINLLGPGSAAPGVAVSGGSGATGAPIPSRYSRVYPSHDLLSAILSPLGNPELGTLLGRADLTLDGEPRSLGPSVSWSPWVAELVQERRAFYRDQLLGLRETVAPGVDRSKVVRSFWKALQLTLIQRSAGCGEVAYPLTRAAVERRLAAVGESLPSALEPLATGLDETVPASDLRRLLAQSCEYVEDVVRRGDPPAAGR